MPFFFNNENIEVIIEDNPDDIFNPSDTTHTPTSQHSVIRQIILEEIIETFKKVLPNTAVENAFFSQEESLKENNYLSYLLTFETDNDEYEIIYHIPLFLAFLIESCQNSNNEMKNKIDEDLIVVNKEIFLNVSNAIMASLNAKHLSFLQDIKLMDFSHQSVDYAQMANMQNLYALCMTINQNKYTLYLELDKQFNKMF